MTYRRTKFLLNFVENYKIKKKIQNFLAIFLLCTKQQSAWYLLNGGCLAVQYKFIE